MLDLRIWIAKRMSYRSWGRRVSVDGEAYVPESIATALFTERQQLVRKLMKERARRKAAEQRALGVEGKS